MEQINNENPQRNETESFWNTSKIILVLLVLGVSIFISYTHIWIPRQQCSSQIEYHPAQGAITEGYYTIGKEGFLSMSKRFKTHSEAVTSCVQSQKLLDQQWRYSN